ncbi:MerR family transcriptional regulator [Aliiglaciecola lipolytica]|uniref:Mercuric resistance operon regulatory protein n=1 Tax=Aliiglaciecola lipolytica E3 TaxID=1127673 RepID=K6X552_9ALTE|nr:MerR family transcriptional regulator [Aliiglaciecola lipolytica]GAC15754.1 mercuric resistance operon regulatory protein [Aliiglaciecola lipolytica E3]
MKANELAKKAEISKDTLRYYEKIGLLTIPPRKTNGYRDYPESCLDELKFIKMAQSVGFTLKEIKPAIPFLANSKPNCLLLQDAISTQIERIDEKISELEQSKITLNRWLSKLQELL